jgi:hypothetical protein
VPALLALDHAVHIGDRGRILEHTHCCLERHAVLSPVETILSLVPGEEHV